MRFARSQITQRNDLPEAKLLKKDFKKINQMQFASAKLLMVPFCKNFSRGGRGSLKGAGAFKNQIRQH